MRQGIDVYIALAFFGALDASQCVRAINVHGAASADTLSTGSTEGERGINLVFHLDECIENHGAAVVHIDLEPVQPRILFRFWIPAVDIENPHVFRVFGGLVGFPFNDF